MLGLVRVSQRWSNSTRLQPVRNLPDTKRTSALVMQIWFRTTGQKAQGSARFAPGPIGEPSCEPLVPSRRPAPPLVGSSLERADCTASRPDCLGTDTSTSGSAVPEAGQLYRVCYELARAQINSKGPIVYATEWATALNLIVTTCQPPATPLLLLAPLIWTSIVIVICLANWTGFVQRPQLDRWMVRTGPSGGPELSR